MQVRHLCAGYVVLVGDRDEEISRRATGQIYTVLNPGEVSILFVPDERHDKIELEAEADANEGGWQIRNEDDKVIGDSRLFDAHQRWRLQPGSIASIYFGGAALCAS